MTPPPGRLAPPILFCGELPLAVAAWVPPGPELAA